MRRVLVAALLLALAQGSRAADIPVTTVAQAVAAMASASAGDQLIFAQGTYGSVGAPVDWLISKAITLRAAPQARVTIIGFIDVKPGTAGVIVRDLELRNKGVASAKAAIQLHGPFNKAINNDVFCENSDVMGNGHGGIDSWQQNGGGPGQEIYGNNVHGCHHPMYSQNDYTTDGYKKFTHNIIGKDVGCATNCSRYSFHGYTEGGFSSGYWLEENIIQDSPLLTGSTNGSTHHVVLLNNVALATNLSLSYSKPSSQPRVEGNKVFRGAINALLFKPGSIRIVGNEIYNPGPSKQLGDLRITDGTTDSSGFHKVPFSSSDVIDLNRFLRVGTSIWSSYWFAPPSHQDCCGNSKFTTYRADLQLASCQNCEANGGDVVLPGSPRVFLFDNAYEANRGEMAIVDWGTMGPHAVDVDLSPVVAVGTPISIMRAVLGRWSTPVWQGTYVGGKVPVPMVGEMDSFLVIPGGSVPPPTVTATNTPTSTPTMTPTSTPSVTPSATPTATPTNTATWTPSPTPTYTPTPTPTMTDLQQQDRIIALERRVLTPTP